MKNKIRKLIGLICIIIFLYSSFQIGSTLYEYHKIEKESNEITDKFVVDDNVKEEDAGNPLNRVVNFNELQKINKDIIGWIYIPDTKIDEPILKGKTNKTYLRTTLKGKYSIAGQIFVDERNNGDFKDKNTIIYGHNMKNGSRFHEVKKFVEKDYFNNHPNVYIYLPDGTINIYSIYVSRILNGYSDLYNVDINYGSYVDEIQKGARQVRKVSDDEAPIILLTTCVASNNDNRFIISARLERQITERHFQNN